MQKIIDDPIEAKDEEKYLAALTAGDRVTWAQARNKYFKTKRNKYSLESIEQVGLSRSQCRFKKLILNSTKGCVCGNLGRKGLLCGIGKRNVKYM